VQEETALLSTIPTNNQEEFIPIEHDETISDSMKELLEEFASQLNFADSVESNEGYFFYEKNEFQQKQEDQKQFEDREDHDLAIHLELQDDDQDFLDEDLL